MPLLFGLLAQTACAERSGADVAGTDIVQAGQLALENPGFEEAGGEMSVPGWNLFQHAGEPSYVMTIDKKSPGKGKQSLRLTQTLPQFYGLVEQKVKATPDMAGKMVEFAALAKTSKVGEKGWLVWIYLYDSSEQLLAEYHSQPLLGTTKWQRISAVGKVLPNTSSFTVGVQMLDEGNQGIGWADDLKMRVFEPEVVAKP